MTDNRPAFCARCGAEAPPSGQYCAECGADLLAEAGVGPESGDTPTADTAPPVSEDGEAVDTESLATQQTVTRRRLLTGLAVGTVVIGGGLVYLDGQGTSTEHEVYGEGWAVQTETGQRAQRLYGTVTIPAGRYAARDLKPEVNVEYTIDYSVTEDQPIDVLVMPRPEYDRYRERDEQFQYYTGLTATDDAAATLTSSLNPGNYMFVLDNTGVYGADPEGEVTVDLEVIAKV